MNELIKQLAHRAFVDPSGGPFVSVGDEIEGRIIVRIMADPEGILFKVE